MAIAFDAASGSSTNGTTSQSHSHTCTGSNLGLVVGVTGDTTGNGDNITGATYNGVAMTLVVKANDAGRWLYLFYLNAPATGAHNIVVSASVSCYIGIAAASYTGVSQSGQPEANAHASGQTQTVTTIAANAWTVMAAKDESGSIVAGASTTKRAGDGFGGDLTGIFDSNVALAAGSHSLAFSGTSNNNSAGIIVSLAPVASASFNAAWNQAANTTLSTGARVA